jgi:putative Ca2+/H+ antiporter (TMEM165/GDT1 family)
MALRYSEIIVFLGAYGALFLMTILSTAFGKFATSWISPLFTNIIVTILFLYFGVRMLLDAKNHEETEGNEDMKAVEHELKEMETKFIER